MSSAQRSEHYFTSGPSAPERKRTIAVELGGHRDKVVVSNGVFSPSRVDPGTAVLLRTVPLPGTRVDGPMAAPEHRVTQLLDLGCGWGPIALSLAIAAPDAHVWAVDVNERALELTQTNADRMGLENVITALPDGVPTAVRFDEIWSNPPIRIGKEALHRVLEKWLARLAPDGVAWLVVQRNLGADSLAKWLRSLVGYEVEKVGSSKGYRVLRVSYSTASSSTTSSRTM